MAEGKAASATYEEVGTFDEERDAGDEHNGCYYHRDASELIDQYLGGGALIRFRKRRRYPLSRPIPPIPEDRDERPSHAFF